jgi:hypothetical protein
VVEKHKKINLINSPYVAIPGVQGGSSQANQLGSKALAMARIPVADKSSPFEKSDTPKKYTLRPCHLLIHTGLID